MEIKHKNFKEIYSLVEKIDEEALNKLLDFLKNDLNTDLINDIKKNYSLRNLKMTTSEIVDEKNNWADKLYKTEINELLLIMSNKDLIEFNNGLKVLVYGETGTGKTSFIKKILSANPAYKIKEINWEFIVDPKMGQTQINLLKLSGELGQIKEKTVIFLDEIDSFVTNRISGNDLGEYSRIVGSFIKFMDNLPTNIIFFAATNLIDKIDDAIKRRFNIKIKSKILNLEETVEFITYLGINFELSKQELNFLKKHLKKEEFTFSEINDFIFKFKIKSKTKDIKHNWVFFVNNLPNNFPKITEILENKELNSNKKREIKEELR